MTSDGGDVGAALSIGRLIRENRASTFVQRRCYSSCVLVLAGGVERGAIIEMFGQPVAKVGIHRPYTTGEPTSYEEHRKKFSELERQVKQFLQEGSVSERLWDDMVKIPPENIKFLTHADLASYGLIGTDPAYADFEDSKAAARYGISKQEYLRRKSTIGENCKSNDFPLTRETFKALAQCREDVLYGRTP